jgi:hypothetical protein
VVVLQTVPAALQMVSFVAEHGLHAPLAWQAGDCGSPQLVSLMHLVHVCVSVSHSGRLSWQSELVLHATHASVAVLHTGVAPVHWALFPLEHCWQLPAFTPVVMQTGLVGSSQPPVGPSALQGVQAWIDVSQRGVLPEQFESLSQVTHRPVSVLQAGEGPPHWVLFVLEHWPHEPSGWQAGVSPLQSVSCWHGAQVSDVVSQIGVVPEHCVLLLPEHC